MSRHKGAEPETHVVGSQPIYEDEVIKLVDGSEFKTGRKERKMDIAQALFTAAGKPVGQRLLRSLPAWTMPKPLGFISHFINEAAKRRCDGDMRKARPEELVQVPVYRGIQTRIANQMRSNAKHQRQQALSKAVVAELAKRRAAAEAVAAQGKAA